MPIFHTQYNGEGTTPEGKTLKIPSQYMLAQQGPIVRVSITIHSEVIPELNKRGQPIPAPISGNALIDTGAMFSCIDNETANQLKLPVIDVVKMASASHPSTDQNVYPTHIEFVGTEINIDIGRTVGASLASLGIIALLGRDFLSRCTLHYNGFTGQITISM